MRRDGPAHQSSNDEALREVIPILTSAEMRVADALAVTQRGVSALVDAAGTSVGLEAKQLLGTVYGRRVAVLVGPGLNGADGRVAGQWLAARGARVDVFEVARQPGALRGFDLVIDAAFGLGCTRPYVAPRLGGATLVLAVDLPSGVEADSGKILGAPLVADVTLALGALKAAHLSGPASSFVGELRFASLGIVSSFVDGLIEDSDLNELITVHRDDNKWTHAVQVIAGSTLMPGAAWMVASGALAGGASMIRLASRGEAPNLMALPPEVVRVTESAVDRRSRAVVAGPGLGADASAWLRERLLQVQVPVVLDADGLHRDLLPGPRAPQHRWILTPHEGEFTRLTGQALGEDRIGDVRTLARETGCVVLLKGSTTILADPTGTLRVVRSGTSALATAGSGDVLAGLIAATIARGHDPLEAGALAAHLHGRAGAQLHTYAPASELVGEVTTILARIAHGTYESTT